VFNPEDSVLSVLLADNSAYWDVADLLKPHDFTGIRADMFAAIAGEVAAGRPIDALTLADLLGHEAGMEALDIQNNVIGLRSSLKTYASQVAKRSEKGRVREAGQKIAQSSESYAEAQAILAAVRPEQTARVKSVEDGLTEMVEALQVRFNAGDEVSGVPTGVAALDDLTSGWQPGNLIVLVGETSMGKSALALQSALSAAAYGIKHNKRALYFSLEMTAGELTERAVCNLADFPLRYLTHPKGAPEYAMDYVTRGSRLFKELPLLIDDQCGLTLDQIVSRSTQHHMRKELCLIVVDYMHIMGRPRRNDVSELGGISTGLKNLSKTLGVPVMGLHQLNRGTTQYGRTDRRPELGDIRASGEIAETANTVIGIYRSEIGRKDFKPLQGTAEALVLKQRQGERNVRAWMKSRLANMRLESCDPPEGYDKHITPDIEPAGTSTGNGYSGGGTAGVRSRSQSRSLSVVSGND
jgi:replicative DNA helicase